MTHEDIMSRRAELKEALKAGSCSKEELDRIKAELIELDAQDTELRNAAAAEERRRQVAAENNAHVLRNFTAVIEEEKPMTITEIRSSADYAKAFLKAIKGDDSEARALLSTQVVGGQIPVPTQLETEIKNAWENYSVMGLVKKSYFPGNVKVGFELFATGAVVHTEGANAPDEETITIGSVELKPESIKKWITVSDEAIEGTTVDTMGYLYAEIAHKIVEKAEEIMIGKIDAAPTVSTSTACAVADFTAAPDVDTIVLAESLLSAQARDLHVVMNRQTYAAFVSAALKNKYNADVFDGLKDRVVFTDKLPAYSAASSTDTYVIIGDFGYGAQANFPAGNDITIKMDDMSLAEKDLVKLVGRQYVGMGVVAEKCFVRIKKA